MNPQKLGPSANVLLDEMRRDWKDDPDFERKLGRAIGLAEAAFRHAWSEALSCADRAANQIRDLGEDGFHIGPSHLIP